MREEKEMAAPQQMAEVIFLLAAKFLCAPGDIKAEQNTSSTKRNISTIGTQKYPWIHPRFYSPFGRNKPRHALSLQTRSVGVQKGFFAFSPSVWRESMKKNVKSLIFRKKTSNFLSSLPLRRKSLIINENMMVHRENNARTTNNNRKWRLIA